MQPDLPPVYRITRWFIRTMLRIFFRKITVLGAEQLDTSRGGLVVAWHPNGLIDPGLIFSFFPGRIVFGARHGLLEWPLLGRLFKAIGTVPIYRASDSARRLVGEQHHQQNQPAQQQCQEHQTDE